MKRAFDLFVVLVTSPFWTVGIFFIFLIAKASLKGSVIFQLNRPGQFGKPFLMYKFRTMTNARNSDGELLSDGERITKFGSFLRKTSLDELPELFNILKGEMSLVGPRPLLMEYLPLYNEAQKKRHNVLPGITGWAQVNGRNAISWEEKFKLDVWYVENQSFWLDVRILWMTIKKVIMREGVSADNHATMPKFTGNAKKDNK